MPQCGRIVDVTEHPHDDSWTLTIRPSSLRDRVAAVLNSSFQSGVEVVGSREQHDGKIAIRTQNAQVRSAMPKLLELLSRSVTIADDADVSHAIAIHRYADIEEHSYVGELVQRAKYFDQPLAETAELTAAVLTVIEAHPAYQRATHVTCPPSSSGKSGAGLAAHLAGAISQRLAITQLAIWGPERAPRKQTDSLDDCAEVHGTFRVSVPLRGATVLVVDDLYGAGCTSDEAVRALRAAGARHVLVLACSKTAKRCNGLPANADDWPDWIPSEVLGAEDALPFE